jgi:hypothetical protein
VPKHVGVWYLSWIIRAFVDWGLKWKGKLWNCKDSYSVFTHSATCKRICTDFVQNQLKLVTCRTATEREQLQSRTVPSMLPTIKRIWFTSYSASRTTAIYTCTITEPSDWLKECDVISQQQRSLTLWVMWIRKPMHVDPDPFTTIPVASCSSNPDLI